MRRILIIYFFLTFSNSAFCDKIYILNNPGYNQADSILISYLSSLGHTVYVNDSLPELPVNFTSVCIDSINGYDWLCFFGDFDYSFLTTEIQNFISSGGKVYYQYEVNCCVTSSQSVSTILSSLTGLSIIPDTNSWIAMNLSAVSGWQGQINFSCDSLSVNGNAYKGLNGVPINNQFLSTNTISGAYPPITNCMNFGFKFSANETLFPNDNGAIIGLGDYNIWYSGSEPPNPSFSAPLDTNLVRLIFPPIKPECSLFSYQCQSILIECEEIQMPNVFTPNEDNLNNLFRPYYFDCLINPNLKIFNRWGIKIHETSDLSIGWDGKYNGKYCSQGTYYWILTYENNVGKIISKKGWLSLLK